MSVEDRIRADPDWQRGVSWGEPGPGHPEATVAEHVDEVLANVEEQDPALRDRLRVIALVHDAFKGDVGWWPPGRTDHARLAARFVRRYTDDRGIVRVTAQHDDAYRAWRFGRRTGLWRLARLRARLLIWRMGDDLLLFRAFYACDNATGDKAPDDRLWFEGLVD